MLGMGRLLAICQWLAWQSRRPFRRASAPLRRAAPLLVGALLVVVAALPIVIPMLDAQPQDATIAEIAAGAVGEPSGWVRLRGELVHLEDSPTGRRGNFSIFVDATDQLDAIILRGPNAQEAESTMITGLLKGALVTIEPAEIPLTATVFGAPPEVVPNFIVALDDAPKPARSTWWPLSIPPLILAAALVVGAGRQYPVFRQTTEVDVLTTPLAPGERLAGVWGGRLGSNERELADPGAVLLVVRPGQMGNILTAQPLPDGGGPMPDPVPIGGGWTSGTVGEVYTIRETLPALQVRTDNIDATFLFPKRGERDRVAALVAVDRG
jgi:hypothetical protein